MQRKNVSCATTILAVLAVLAFHNPARAAPPEDTLVSTGETLLQSHCERCHAIGKLGSSTHEQAPPFRDVIVRYPPEHLAEALAEGIFTGHPDMPEFTFSPDEIDAIIAYLNWLGTPDTAP